MGDENKTSGSFLPVAHAASRLGVPAKWLRAEAAAGRVPCLRAGRRLLMNPQAVEAALLARAQTGNLRWKKIVSRLGCAAGILRALGALLTAAVKLHQEWRKLLGE